MQQPEFSFEIEKESPLWLEFLQYSAMLMIGWGTIHLTMNWNAYAEIAEFRVNNAIESVKELYAQNEQGEQDLGANIGFYDEVIPNYENASKLQNNVINTTTNFQNTKQKAKDLEEIIPNEKRSVFSAMPLYPSDNRLVIPRLGKSIPLVDVPNHTNFDVLESGMQNALKDGVAVHPVSKPPTENGNFFLTGHSSYYFYDPGRFKDVFALLHEVDNGEEIEVYWEGKKFVYVVNAQMVVEPDQVDVLRQPENKKMLTLMTCTPIGTAKNRLILTAEPKYTEVVKRGISIK